MHLECGVKEIRKKVAKELNIGKKLNLHPDTITDLLIADGTITEVDKLGEIKFKGQIPVPSSPRELSEKFDMFIQKNASPYAMVDSSDRIKTAIYTFLKDNYKISKYSKEAQKIVLGKNTKVKINDIPDLYNAKIDTGAYSTSISEDIAEKIGFKDTLDRFNSIKNRFGINMNMNISNIYQVRDSIKKEHPEFNITIIKSGNGMSIRLVVDITIQFIDKFISIDSKASVENREHLKYNLIIGRKDLRNFLIDVTKNT